MHESGQNIFYFLYCVSSLLQNLRQWRETEALMFGHIVWISSWCKSVTRLERVWTSWSDMVGMPVMWPPTTNHYSKTTQLGAQGPSKCTAVPNCCTGYLFNSTQLNDFLALMLHAGKYLVFWWALKNALECEIKLCMGAYQRRSET